MYFWLVKQKKDDIFIDNESKMRILVFLRQAVIFSFLVKIIQATEKEAKL